MDRSQERGGTDNDDVGGDFREQTITPPVGLNWHRLSEYLGVDRMRLERDGAVVLRGEYVPEAGYVFDPNTLKARFVRVGGIVLKPSLFLSELAIRDFRARIAVEGDTKEPRYPVIPTVSRGPIIALFADMQSAVRVKQRILDGSLGQGVDITVGPLGAELRVNRAELGGRVATLVTNHGGALIAIAGEHLAGTSSLDSNVPSGTASNEAGATSREPTSERPVPYGETGL